MSEFEGGGIRREIDLLRFQLRQADERLAQSQEEVLQLRQENIALRHRAEVAQKQLRTMRSTPAWRTSVALMSVEGSAKRRMSRLISWLRSVKRRVIG